MTIPQIVELLDFCLNTYMTVHIICKYMEQLWGQPYPPVANCYMNESDKLAISTAPHPYHCGYATWTHYPYFLNSTWMSSLNTSTMPGDPVVTQGGLSTTQFKKTTTLYEQQQNMPFSVWITTHCRVIRKTWPDLLVTQRTHVPSAGKHPPFDDSSA